MTNSNINSSRYYLAKIYFNNVEEICNIGAALSKNIANRMRKGLPVDLERLAGCSTVKGICSHINRYCLECEGFTPLRTKKDFADMRQYIADVIIENAEYEFNNN